MNGFGLLVQGAKQRPKKFRSYTLNLQIVGRE